MLGGEGAGVSNLVLRHTHTSIYTYVGKMALGAKHKEISVHIATLQGETTPFHSTVTEEFIIIVTMLRLRLVDSCVGCFLIPIMFAGVFWVFLAPHLF